MNVSSCSSSSSSPVYALSSISFYNTKPTIGFIWVKPWPHLKSSLIRWEIPKEKVAVDRVWLWMNNQPRSVPYSMVLVSKFSELEEGHVIQAPGAETAFEH